MMVNCFSVSVNFVCELFVIVGVDEKGQVIYPGCEGGRGSDVIVLKTVVVVVYVINLRLKFCEDPVHDKVEEKISDWHACSRANVCLYQGVICLEAGVLVHVKKCLL